MSIVLAVFFVFCSCVVFLAFLLVSWCRVAFLSVSPNWKQNESVCATRSSRLEPASKADGLLSDRPWLGWWGISGRVEGTEGPPSTVR